MAIGGAVLGDRRARRIRRWRGVVAAVGLVSTTWGAAVVAPARANVAASQGIFDHLDVMGLTATDNLFDVTPPDATGAIGPHHYVEMVNQRIGVYDRTTLEKLTDMDLSRFAGGFDVGDPQVEYDRVSRRWFYLANDIDAKGNDFLAFGFSRTADPTDLEAGWCHYRVNTDMGGGPGAQLDDFPKLGHSDTQVIFGTNVFGPNQFLTARVWTSPKPDAGDLDRCPETPTLRTFGSPSHPLRTADGDLAFTPVPANHETPSQDGFVVAADEPADVLPSLPRRTTHRPSLPAAAATADPTHHRPTHDPRASQLMLWHVNGDGTLVADGNVDVAAYDDPERVRQPGPPANTLDTLDGRLTLAVAVADPTVDGKPGIWTSHTIDGPGGRSVLRWYELVPGADVPHQVGTIADPKLFVFNGAISPALDGTGAAAFYNTGSAGHLIQIRARARDANLPLGQMGPETVIGKSNGVDQDFSCPFSPLGCRWGDYSGASPDPSNPTVVWGSNQANGKAVGDSARWITRNFAVDTTTP